MKVIRSKSSKTFLVGTYSRLKDASRQVDLLLKNNGDLCVNIVQSGTKFHVQTVVLN